MDSSIIKPYNDALSARRAQLQGEVSRGFQAIAIPAGIGSYESKQSTFLSKSAIVFLVLGAAALILGIIIGNMGVIAAAATSLLSGGYLWMKDLQARKAMAFESLSDKVYGYVADIAAKAEADWKQFTSTQADGLKTAIVGSSDADTSKVALIDSVDTIPQLSFDLGKVKTDTQALGTKADIDSYSPYLASLQSRFEDTIASAGTATRNIYNSLAK